VAEINDGGAAFPRQFKRWDTDFQRWEECEPEAGMSLRDYFAAKAMQAFMAAAFTEYGAKEVRRAMGSSALPAEQIAAQVAYRHADAMLKARGA
jgi:hypothetical protein